MELALYIFLTVIVTLLVCALALRIYIRRNTVGTFRFDNNETSPICTFELEKIPEAFEKKKYVLARVKYSELSLPGSHKSQ